MKSKTILFLVGLFVVVIFCSYMKSLETPQTLAGELKKESFQTLGHDAYPSSLETPLLKNDFPLKNPPQFQVDNTYSMLWKEDPDAVLGSYAQVTNNVKYRLDPNNGSCVPAGMCNSFYNKKKPTQHNPPCSPPKLSEDKGVRVNYYNYFY